MEYLIGLIVGSIISSIVHCFLHDRKTAGCIRIDHSDADGPYLFLELSESVEKLATRKEVLLEVKEKDFLPHK